MSEIWKRILDFCDDYEAVLHRIENYILYGEQPDGVISLDEARRQKEKMLRQQEQIKRKAGKNRHD